MASTAVVDVTCLNIIYWSCVRGSYVEFEQAMQITSSKMKYDILHTAVRGACRGGHLDLFKRVYQHGKDYWWWSKMIIETCFGGNRDLLKLILDLANSDSILETHEWNYILQMICINVNCEAYAPQDELDKKTAESTQQANTIFDYEQNVKKRIEIMQDIFNYITCLNKTRAATRPIILDVEKIIMVARYYKHWEIVKFWLELNMCVIYFSKPEIPHILNVMPNYNTSSLVHKVRAKRQRVISKTSKIIDKCNIINKMFDPNVIAIITDYIAHE
jgi:hypothetical protein